MRKDLASAMTLVTSALRQPRDVPQIAAVTGLKRHRIDDVLERLRVAGMVEVTPESMRTFRTWRLVEKVEAK